MLVQGPVNNPHDASAELIDVSVVGAPPTVESGAPSRFRTGIRTSIHRHCALGVRRSCVERAAELFPGSSGLGYLATDEGRLALVRGVLLPRERHVLHAPEYRGQAALLR